MDFTRTEKRNGKSLHKSRNLNHSAAKLLPTKPKRNADFRAKPIGLCIFMKSLNLMDLALDKKNKAKQ